MKRTLACLTMLCAAALAHAQVRTLPADAVRGKIRHVQEMHVLIDGKPAQLSAGAQVRDAFNRVLLPAAIPPDSVVKYRLNAQGHVSGVWILTTHEAAQ